MYPLLPIYRKSGVPYPLNMGTRWVEKGHDTSPFPPEKYPPNVEAHGMVWLRRGVHAHLQLPILTTLHT